MSLYSYFVEKLEAFQFLHKHENEACEAKYKTLKEP